MQLDDLLDLEPLDRVTRLWRRLIPLARQGYDSFPGAVKTFFAVFEWTGEISNGGVHQYFSNSSGDRAADALASLTTLGLGEQTDLFRRSLVPFGGELPPPDRGKRAGLLDGLAESELRLFEDLSGKICDATPAVLQALADHARREAASFAFLNRYPGGFKALPLPEEIRAEALGTLQDPFEALTYAYAFLQDRIGRSRPEALPASARQFLDAFAWADEVSAGGFATYLFSRDADRHAQVLDLLKSLGMPESADLLRRAVEVFPSGLSGDRALRRKQLATLAEKDLEALLSLGRDFQRLRSAAAEQLARFVRSRAGEWN